MEICVINPFFHPYPGGTEKVLLQVYSRLAKRHNITVVSAVLESGEKPHTDTINGIKVMRLPTHYVPLPMLPLPFMVIKGMKQTLKEVDADIYHINNRFLYYSTTLSTIKKMRRKLVLTIHNALPRNIDPLTDSGGKVYDTTWGEKIMRQSDAITGISKSTIESTVPARYNGKTHLVYNGVDFNLFKRRSRRNSEVSQVIDRLGANGENIFTNGRLITQKGQTYLLRAYAELVREKTLQKDSSLVIVGRGPLEHKLKSKARQLGVGKNLKIVSGIPEEKLPFYYNSADLFSLPSLYEPASLAILESLSSELPSVASNTGGLPEMMDGCGLYAEPRDPDGIAEGIRELHANPKKARSMAAKGRRLMVRDHDWNRIAKQYENIFLNIMSK
jgi:glycosyltransferase involved in cell wall biosynthesis